MIKIDFKNIKEIEKYLNYLDTIEFDSELRSCCDDECSITEMFLRDILQDPYLPETLIDYSNETISKLIWGVWIEDGKKILENMYNDMYNTYNENYSRLIKYIQFFKECFTTTKEEEKER